MLRPGHTFQSSDPPSPYPPPGGGVAEEGHRLGTDKRGVL